MLRIKIQTEDFNLSDELAKLTEGNASIGAVATFVGLVRDTNKVNDESADVSKMTLEHYPGMTEKALNDIAVQAAERWSLSAVTIIHRVGELLATDPIVLVMTASVHRQDAFDSCQFVMDTLKTTAPFWKKETLPDGTTRWVESRDSDSDAASRWKDTLSRSNDGM